MAKMTVEFDTESKAFSASIDGKPVPNVCAAEIYPSYEDDEKYRCSFMSRSTDEASGISEVRHLYASKTVRAQAALAAKDGQAIESLEFPGFVEQAGEEESKAKTDIASFFDK